MRNRFSLSLAAAGVTLLASAAAAQAVPTDQAFPKEVDSEGFVLSVAGSNGTAAWISRGARPGTSRDLSLHILKPGEAQATKVALRSKAVLFEMAIEVTDDTTTVVAVASKSPGEQPSDIVSIDPASGAVTKVKGASNPRADERQPALADGTLSFATKTGKRKTLIKQMPLDGGKATTFATLSAKSVVADLATYPDGKKLGLSFATPLKKKKVRFTIATVSKGGKPKTIKARTLGPKDTYGIRGPFVTEEGETLFTTGSVGVNLYRAGESKPVRKLTFFDDAAWVGGDLGLLAVVPSDEDRSLRGTGPME